MKAGLGFRGVIAQEVLRTQPALDFFEIIAEHYTESAGYDKRQLHKLRSDYPVAMHGVSLNLGGPDGPDNEYLKKLKALIHEIQPFVISDHLCWTGSHAHSWFDLLPLPRTQEAIEHISNQIDRVQNFLGRRMAIENTSTYLEFKSNEMSEVDFLNEIGDRADCYFLFDINNIFVNAFNHGSSAREFLEKINRSRIAQMHIAGHEVREGFLFDTHAEPISVDVKRLFQEFGNSDELPPVLLERDSNFPPLKELLDEIFELKTLIEKHDNQLSTTTQSI